MFFFQAEDGIRDLVRSRGLGDVYKRQHRHWSAQGKTGTMASASGTNVKAPRSTAQPAPESRAPAPTGPIHSGIAATACLLYTSDAADERSSVDLGGRRFIKNKHSESAL